MSLRTFIVVTTSVALIIWSLRSLSGVTVNAFMTPTISSRVTNKKLHQSIFNSNISRNNNSNSIPQSTTTRIRSSNSIIAMNKDTNDNNIDVDGMQTAPYIFTFMLLVCIWNFTIPTEFRRARLCSEQQVIDNPQSNCKTIPQYLTGIQQYYQNGGTIFKFDFSIDRDNNIWITGPKN
jgi:hypothetical protein